MSDWPEAKWEHSYEYSRGGYIIYSNAVIGCVSVDVELCGSWSVTIRFSTHTLGRTRSVEHSFNMSWCHESEALVKARDAARDLYEEACDCGWMQCGEL